MTENDLPNCNSAYADDHQGRTDNTRQIPWEGKGKYHPEKRDNSDDLYGGKGVKRTAFHGFLFRSMSPSIGGDAMDFYSIRPWRTAWIKSV